jgi:hypothetical protein
VGAPYDNTEGGAAWIFTRRGGVWTQQGSKLIMRIYLIIVSPTEGSPWTEKP